jgi:elongation factor G
MAEVPQAEMFKYANDLRSMTQARGSFEMEFTKYEEVPHILSEKIVAAAQEEKE